MGEEKITEEAVICKLKDDGDFDRIRLNIVRLLKQNEDLRNNIISAIKESAALNRAGAENMTTRQLCDTIHDEISENVMPQISDGLWKIIRSADSIRSEITETVESIYDKLLKPEGQSPTSTGEKQVMQGSHLNSCEKASGESSVIYSNGVHKEPPGLSPHNLNNYDVSRPEKQPFDPNDEQSVEQQKEPHQSNGLSRLEDGDTSPPPGFLLHGKRKRASDNNDEDPDIPPGFG